MEVSSGFTESMAGRANAGGSGRSCSGSLRPTAAYVRTACCSAASLWQSKPACRSGTTHPSPPYAEVESPNKRKAPCKQRRVLHSCAVKSSYKTIVVSLPVPTCRGVRSGRQPKPACHSAGTYLPRMPGHKQFRPYRRKCSNKQQINSSCLCSDASNPARQLTGQRTNPSGTLGVHLCAQELRKRQSGRPERTPSLVA